MRALSLASRTTLAITLLSLLWAVLLPLLLVLLVGYVARLVAARTGLSQADAERRVNDVVGNWLCAYPIWSDTRPYRPYHLQHHAKNLFKWAR